MNLGKLQQLAFAGLGISLSGIASPVFAQSTGNGNGDVRQLIIDTVCNHPAPGSLFATRCGQTKEPGKDDNDPTAYAQITLNSESSLYPNQTAAAASSALASAQQLAIETEAKLKALRDKDAGQPGSDSGEIASFGRWSLLTNVEGEWFDQSRLPYAGERGFNGKRFRFSLGTDYRLGGTSHIGLLVSYEKLSLGFDGEPSSGSFQAAENAGGQKRKALAATFFASVSPSRNSWIDAAAGVGWSWHNFRRNATFQPTFTPSINVPVRAVADTDGKQFFLSVGTGYDFEDGPLSVGPYARVRYSHVTIAGYDEHDTANSGLEFKVSKQTADSLASVLGVRGSYAISTSWGAILPQARFEYEHEFHDGARDILTSFVRDPNNKVLTVKTDVRDSNYFNLGAGLVFVLPHGLMPFVDYEALLGYSGFNRHRVSVGITKQF